MESIEVQAVAKYIRQSPQKVRRVINVVRGMDAVEALQYLKLMPQRAANPVQKVIKSAVANAEENYELHPDDLYIAIITADQAPIRRWRRFGARGRFKPIKRRYSHIKVILKERK
jgi:large subunit ribosomal protein L22